MITTLAIANYRSLRSIVALLGAMNVVSGEMHVRRFPASVAPMPMR